MNADDVPAMSALREGAVSTYGPYSTDSCWETANQLSAAITTITGGPTIAANGQPVASYNGVYDQQIIITLTPVGADELLKALRKVVRTSLGLE